MSEKSTELDLKKLAWLGNLAAIYVGVCIGLHFIYPPNQQYNDIIKHCGNSSAFCACQAQAIVDQRNFFTQPLIFIGLKTFRKVAPMCAANRG